MTFRGAKRLKRGSVAALWMFASMTQAAPGSVSGRVTFVGEKPAAVPLKRGTDPVCAKQKMDDPSILLGRDGKTLANVVVRVVKGAKDIAAPAQPIRVNQESCMYSPRVQAAVSGQKILINNSDATLHNVRAQDGAKSIFNVAQPPKSPPVEREVAVASNVLKLKCDVHPWMTGYIVFNHNPYFAVSDASGKFAISGLPPGHYSLEAWHEVLGTQVAEVDVVSGKPTAAQFRFAAKATP